MKTGLHFLSAISINDRVVEELSDCPFGLVVIGWVHFCVCLVSARLDGKHHIPLGVVVEILLR